MLRLLSLLITLPLSMFVLLFAISNTHAVTVRLYLFEWTAEWPLYTVALGLMAAGFLTGGLLVWLNLYHYRIRYWQASRKLAKYESATRDSKAAARDIPEDTASPPLPAPRSITHDRPAPRPENNGPVNPYQAAFGER